MRALSLSRAALGVGLVYAGVSVYWGLGGRELLSTVSRMLTAPGHPTTGELIAGAWIPAVVKATAAYLPVLAVSARLPPARRRLVVRLSWVEAALLVVYGFVLTATGLLVQAGVIHPPPSADRRALAWHAGLWDPWFLVWGVLVTAAMITARERRPVGDDGELGAVAPLA